LFGLGKTLYADRESIGYWNGGYFTFGEVITTTGDRFTGEFTKGYITNGISAYKNGSKRIGRYDPESHSFDGTAESAEMTSLQGLLSFWSHHHER
jgi:hypothetical protein